MCVCLIKRKASLQIFLWCIFPMFHTIMVFFFFSKKIRQYEYLFSGFLYWLTKVFLASCFRASSGFVFVNLQFVVRFCGWAASLSVGDREISFFFFKCSCRTTRWIFRVHQPTSLVVSSVVLRKDMWSASKAKETVIYLISSSKLSETCFNLLKK